MSSNRKTLLNGLEIFRQINFIHFWRVGQEKRGKNVFLSLAEGFFETQRNCKFTLNLLN